MSEQISEQISALLDGELPEAELSLLLRQIDRQPEVLQQAQNIQQVRMCMSGDQPSVTLSDSLLFTSRIQAAIRNDQAQPSYDLRNISGLSDQLKAQDMVSQSDKTSQAMSFSTTPSAAANDSKWRPYMGAGIAAAVAVFAISAWQSQTIDDSMFGVQAPLTVQSDMQQNSGLSIPVSNASEPSISQQTPANTKVSGQSLNSTLVNASESSETSYTVPNFEDLNVDRPLSNMNDLRQVKYSDYLLQNQVAPQSTGTHLSRFAQQLRATHTQQFYIDPRTGLVVMTIKPIENK